MSRNLLLFSSHQENPFRVVYYKNARYTLRRPKHVRSSPQQKQNTIAAYSESDSRSRSSGANLNLSNSVRRSACCADSFPIDRIEPLVLPIFLPREKSSYRPGELSNNNAVVSTETPLDLIIWLKLNEGFFTSTGCPGSQASPLEDISKILLLITIEPAKSLVQLQNVEVKEAFVASSRIYSDHRVKKREVLVRDTSEYMFDVQLSDTHRPITARIRPRSSDLIKNKSILINIIDEFGTNIKDVSSLYEGYIIGNPNSSVSGYINEGNFYGHLIVNDSFYYIDELRHFDSSNDVIVRKNAVIFKKDKVTIGLVVNETPSAKTLFRNLMTQNYYQKQFIIWKGQGKLCPMIIVIDHSFLAITHNFNIEAAIFHVTFSLEEANAIFRSTDFDGDGKPDNIGFYIKDIYVIENNERIDYIPAYTENAMDVMHYLTTFTRLRNLSKYCLGIIFTAQKFDRGTLGASFTPDSTSLHPTSGICDKTISGLGTMNCLVITASTTKTPLVNQAVFEVSIIHELGHSFGAEHDTGQCFGHIMSPSSFTDYSANKTRLIFSSCSRERIVRTLVLKGDCFEPIETPFCGNGIVEDGEDCDCGLTLDCLRRDPCCVPRRTTEYPCKVNLKKGFECHPSQGKCCTKKCKYNKKLQNFVDCETLHGTCPCPKNTSCNCGVNGMCIENQCISIDCARIGLEECICQLKTPEKACQVCCQLNGDCVPAYEATRELILEETKVTVLNRFTSIQTGESTAYKIKKFIKKTFCQKDRCVDLPFFRGEIGELCLFRGNLGKCRSDSRCIGSEPRQAFPCIRSASTKFAIHLINIFCNLTFNGFLIYSLY